MERGTKTSVFGPEIVSAAEPFDATEIIENSVNSGISGEPGNKRPRVVKMERFD